MVGTSPNKPARTGSSVNISHLTGKRRGAIVKEEVVQRGAEVMKYSLAYINPRICGVDNGRVLGYDNSHGRHHRHHMGLVSSISFPGYEALLDRFRQEVIEIWKREDEQEG